MEKTRRITLTPQYFVLMLLADTLIVLGAVVYFFPVLLAPVGKVLAGQIHDNWYWIIAMGVAVGAVNFLLNIGGRKRA